MPANDASDRVAVPVVAYRTPRAAAAALVNQRVECRRIRNVRLQPVR
jgi:hypothetical protein